MLKLTRRIGETVFIGDDIKVTVLGFKGTRINIGIQAPQDYRILREELLANDNGEDWDDEDFEPAL